PESAVRHAVRLSRLGADVFIHCALMQPTRIATRPGRGRAEDAAAVPAVWCDLDLAKPDGWRRYLPTRADAGCVFAQLPIRPTLTVWSGGGYHLWWVLKEPLVLDSAETRTAAERLVRRWQAYLRQHVAPYALDATHDLARVLRVPGTLNTKYGVPV